MEVAKFLSKYLKSQNWNKRKRRFHDTGIMVYRGFYTNVMLTGYDQVHHLKAALLCPTVRLTMLLNIHLHTFRVSLINIYLQLTKVHTI